MTIKKHTDVSFAVVPLDMALDDRISLAALKVSVYILGHHPDWTISVADVAKQTKLSRSATTTAFDNLEACGYMTADRVSIRGRLCRTNIQFSNKPEFTPVAKVVKVKPCEFIQVNSEPLHGSNLNHNVALDVAPEAAPAPAEVEISGDIFENYVPTKDERAEQEKDRDTWARLIPNRFARPTETDVERTPPMSGPYIKSGMVLSRLGFVLRKANPGDYAALDDRTTQKDEA